ncbi:hypothetical protein [uncultured Tessaracoccus sp.]|uniref:hypothetical protein n=1 Tax=uncultured Tessaracoccus sp. TaxID=905023 RepID=UPI0025F818A3|nr:hypothetical protein [uncultured Tessaracoccus sp.]
MSLIPHPRRSLTALGLSALLLGVAGCGGGDDPSPEPDTASDAGAAQAQDVVEEEATETAGPRAEIGETSAETFVGALDELNLEAVADKEKSVLDFMGVRYRVTKAGAPDAVSSTVATKLVDTDEAWADEVSAGDGFQFCAAELIVEQSVYPTPEPKKDPIGLPEIEIRAGGTDVLPGFSFPEEQAVGDTFTFVGTPRAEDGNGRFVFVASQQGVAQQLDLCTGERTASDLEYLYTSPTTATIGEPNSWNKPFKGAIDDNAKLEGKVTTAVVVPTTDGSNWLDGEQLYLGIDIKTAPNDSLDHDKTEVRLVLPDETEVPPLTHVSGFGERFQHRLWFPFPADTKEAKLKLHLIMDVSSRSKVDDLGVVEVPVTFSRG